MHTIKNKNKKQKSATILPLSSWYVSLWFAFCTNVLIILSINFVT